MIERANTDLPRLIGEGAGENVPTDLAKYAARQQQVHPNTLLRDKIRAEVAKLADPQVLAKVVRRAGGR
jgi:hypothetical protein